MIRGICILVLAAALAGCMPVVQVRNAKSGETTKCGGGMWPFNDATNFEHCLKYYHQNGFDPVL